MSGKLAPYRRKRNSTRTPEPPGSAPAGETAGAATDASPAPGSSRRFVVHRHRARRLHYDLRFEINGVLVSWAVPRGPTLDPHVKRLAVRVEDHPIEYLDFEGVIPEDEYGAGDVIVWDRGTWEPHATDDPAAAVEAGELHADVRGQKLRGRLILVRRDKNRPGSGGSDQWLLMHKHDEYAVKGWNPEDYPRSVLSGRTNEEVRADPERCPGHPRLVRYLTGSAAVQVGAPRCAIADSGHENGPGLTSFRAVSGSVGPTPNDGHIRAIPHAPRAGTRA